MQEKIENFIMNYHDSMADKTYEELIKVKEDLSLQLSHMILDDNLLIKIAVIDALLDEKK